MESMRTPEGLPSNCPLCKAEVKATEIEPNGDAECPACRIRLRLAVDALDLFQKRFGENLGPRHASVTQDMTLADLGATSLDTVEFVLELEEAFHFRLPEDALDQFDSVGDIIRFIQRQHTESA